MCAVGALIFYEEKPLDLDKQKHILNTMMELMTHRGPDHKGTFRSSCNRVLLGHNRLSIISTDASSNQPMVNQNQDAIIFNGEIYNYLELKEELKNKNHPFLTNSDTEVILKGYQEWGVDLFNKLKGMWAIIIWDKANSKIIVSRDRSAIKPLYYIIHQQGLIFSSEVKPLITAAREINLELTLKDNFVQSFLSTGRFFENGNINEVPFREIQEFPEANFSTIDLKEKEISFTKFWDAEKNIQSLSEVLRKLSPIEKEMLFKEILSNSLKEHLRSDVPIGFSLSGGLDSSTLLTLSSKLNLTKQKNSSLNTYSIDYNYEGFKEVYLARQLCKELDVNNHSISPNSTDFVKSIDDMTWLRDVPSNAFGFFSMWNIMKKASERVKVIIGGQGADELFAGYHYYYPYWATKKILDGNDFDHVMASIFDKTSKGIYQSIKQHVIANISNGQKIAELSAYCKSDLKGNLKKLLMNEDRASMAASIESRVPFLDVDVIEFALALEPEDLIDNQGWTKSIIRRSMNDLLPSSICWRREKLGYATPFHLWLRSGEVLDILDQQNMFLHRFISPSNLIKIKEKALTSASFSKENETRIWFLINLERYFQLIKIL